MNKLVASYMIIFVVFVFLSSIMDGAGGINATELSGAITTTSTTITVDDTTGFLAAGVIVIGNEQIQYTGIGATTFTGATRAFNNTKVSAHLDNSRVYSRETSVLNRALGFEVVSTGETIGTAGVAKLAFQFFTRSLGYLVSFDYAFLTGELVYLRYLFMAPAVGLVIYFGAMAMQTVFGILRR